MNKKKAIFIGAGVFTAIILICIITFAISAGPVDKDDKQLLIVEVTQGSSTADIAYTLEDKGTITNVFTFKLVSKVFGYDGEYKVGKYAVSKSMSMKEQMDVLTSGKSIGDLVTVPSGNTLEKDAKIFANADLFTEDEFLKEVENGEFDYKFLDGIPDRANKLEGFLYPETYKVELGAKPRDVIDMMLKQFDKIFTDEYYEQAKKNGRTVMETITIASIIEREAQTGEDKKNVASVIYNRLKIGMPLQMDSILAYITGEEKIKASLEDTKVVSAYNPYTNIGLPPGPICSPSKDSIEAALYPANTKYLYFVATDKLDGTNVFSETYEDFLKNKKAFDDAYKEYIKKNPGKK